MMYCTQHFDEYSRIDLIGYQTLAATELLILEHCSLSTLVTDLSHWSDAMLPAMTPSRPLALHCTALLTRRMIGNKDDRAVSNELESFGTEELSGEDIYIAQVVVLM